MSKLAALTQFDLFKKKVDKEKITMITCYDYSMAKILNQTDIDCILVGDSAAMIMHGYSQTLQADLDMMELHTLAVSKGAPHKMIVGDLPFLSFRKGLSEGVEAAGRLMKSGAHAVKLEGARGNIELIEHLVASGIPVMGHLGLTPQSIFTLGGFKVQARSDEAKLALKSDALALQGAGCFSIVLECVPSQIAKEVTESLAIPTIGIGAGNQTDGQVLVLQDLLGMNPNFAPKFLRKFANLYEEIQKAVNQFSSSVKSSEYPSVNESYEG